MTVTPAQETIELICITDAIPAAEREAHLATAQRLVLDAYIEMKELDDGYAFKYPAEEFNTIVTYISNERHCCAFFTFDLKITPNQGPIWFHIHGNEQIKEFLKNELQSIGNQDVA